MKHLRGWLLRFMDAYAKAKWQDHTDRLEKRIERLTTENRTLNAYIDGLQLGLKHTRKRGG